MIASLEARWDRRIPSWAEGALIGLVSRAFSVAVLFIAYAANLPKVRVFWPSPFEMWDGFWFQEIARRGYHAGFVVPGYHDFAFFPAWPVVIRIASLNGLVSLPLAATVAANLLFIAAAALIFMVLERLGGRSYARVGLLLFAFSPAAYAYSADYSEPLFLVAAAAFFLSSGPGRSAVAAALGMLTRLGGIALAAAAVADLLRPETRKRGIASIAGVALAFAAWWVFIAVLTGDPMGYMQGSPAWFSAHGTTLATGVESIVGPEQPGAFLTGLYVILLVAGAVRLIKDGELRLGFYSAACLASTVLVTWSTMARLASIAFPAFGALGELLPNRWARAATLVGFASAQAVSAWLAVLHIVTP